MTEIDPFFAELEAEIAKATKKSRLKSDAEKLRKDALNTKLSSRERARAAEEYKSLQSLIEAQMWRPIATGAMFTEQVCDGCGSIHYTFLQYMQEEERISQPSTRRWVRANAPNLDLPLETIVQPLTTHICSDCCEDHGFNAAAPTIRLLPRGEALTVSPTYEQGDINGPLETDRQA